MNDYKAEFHDAVTELIAEDIVDRSERMAAVHALTDAYLDSVGVTPDGAELERLTDYILREELTDRHPDKVTRDEYPFFSAWQLELRRDRETSEKAAEEYGADRRNNPGPGRRRRDRYENGFVDRNARIRNRERAAQYKRDTAPGPVETYNLWESGEGRQPGELTEEFTQRIGIGARWLADMAAVNEVTVEPAIDEERAAA